MFGSEEFNVAVRSELMVCKSGCRGLSVDVEQNLDILRIGDQPQYNYRHDVGESTLESSLLRPDPVDIPGRKIHLVGM